MTASRRSTPPSTPPTTPPTTARTEGAPRVLRERYRLDATIGEGGMGVVYRGLDLALERVVAVKLMRALPGADPHYSVRFLREGKIAAKTRHEHVVEVFDVGEDASGDLFYVMELLEGESLSRRLKRERRLSPGAAVHLAAQVCEALTAIHRDGVIHRDLKPANVMLLRRGSDDAFVKLIDFGISKVTDHATAPSRTGEMVGTLGYMAPEQIRGERIDERTDLYALGVLLYRALSGADVFEDHGLPAAIHDHLETAPRKLAERAPDAGIPPALDAAVLRCLAKRPEDRFESAAAAATALREAIGSETSAPMDILVKGPEIPPDAPHATEHASESPTDPALQFELADVAAAQTPAPPLGPRVCVQCGTENQRYAQFCSVCSDPLDSAEQVEFRARAPLALAPELIPLVPLAREPARPFDRLRTGLALLPATAKGRLAAHAAAVLVILNAWAFSFGPISVLLLIVVLITWISIFLGPINPRRH
ncbi:MAG: serine/threonine-protein kinase [Byssovorax sp.]